MKVISCIGYHDTGSGAVDDYLREFDNVAQTKYGVECRFLQDPDGVSDLQYNLVENPHRLNSGYALKRFKRFVDLSNHTYSLIFGEAWKKDSYRYIEDLTDFRYAGYWSGDMMLMSQWKRFTYYFRRGLNRLVPKRYKKPSTWNYFPKQETLHTSVTSQQFLLKTQDYVSQLLTALNPENKEFVVLDQAASAMNMSRYLQYFREDTRMIIVDRDPRDIFIEEILLKGRVLPKDPRIFSIVYRDHRQSIDNKTDNSHVLRIRFEDLIYRYKDTTENIRSFIGLDKSHQDVKLRKFRPEISKKNTRLWQVHPEFSEQISIIENMLPEYLYPEQ